MNDQPLLIRVIVAAMVGAVAGAAAFSAIYLTRPGFVATLDVTPASAVVRGLHPTEFEAGGLSFAWTEGRVALLFEGLVPGQPIDYKKAWAVAAADAGLPKLRIHDIRHVVAARLLRSGNTLAVASQVLGHDPAVLARRYGHLETASLRRAQERAW